MSRALRSVTGAMGFGASVGPADAAHLVFVRSPLAHAAILGIDAADAVAMPGVLGVFTAADLDLPKYSQVPFDDDLVLPPLALDEVRYVGQRVAAVVARTLGEAIDAAEMVFVDYDIRPPELDPADGPTVAGPWEIGAPRVSASDDVVITLDLHYPRVSASPIEGTTMVAEPDGRGGVTVHAGSQIPAATHEDLCQYLGLGPEQLRFVSPPMGGAFGAKTVGGSPDITVPTAVSLRLGVPVRFVEDRSSHTAVDHSRDQHQRWTLTADPDGRLRHIALECHADVGAYAGTGAIEPGTTLLLVPGPYRVDAIQVRARSVSTNRAPTGPYRGPGRAEAVAGLERAMDVLAAHLGIDPIELRRRNLLQPGDFPHLTPTGMLYDATDHHANLDAALDLVDQAGWHARRAESADAVERIGIGVSTWVDATAGFDPQQDASLCVDVDGSLSLVPGSSSCGQGHEESFGGLVASHLGVDEGRVRLLDPASTNAVASVGSMGSRSAQLAGNAIGDACQKLTEQARVMAATLLEAAPADIVSFDDGRFGVAGVPDRSVELAEIAAATRDGRPLPEGVEPGLAAIGHFAQEHRTFPAGCHVAVVAVDTLTGAVRLLDVAAATDCGAVLHEASAVGQVHGSMVQGAAVALFEAIEYDTDGNLLTGNFASYAVPAASEVPALRSVFVPTPTDRNPLGAKGLGETGCVGAPAAVQNAVVDALRGFGVESIDMPCTPERVWRAIDAGRGQSG